MRWKTVALAAMAWPGVAGCSIAYNAARNIVNEPLVACTQLGIEHDLRKSAKDAWKEVRADYPRRAFTAEFRDGFLDGYVDYLDRGGNGSLPAIPPAKYTRHKKYFSEEGQCLVKEYFLGFQYGRDIAIATGKRQYLIVPVMLPQETPEPPAFIIAPPATTHGTPPPMPVPTPPVFGPPKPVEPPMGALPAPRPVANAPTPLAPAPIATDLNQTPASDVPPVRIPATPIPRLPAPPAQVPDLPAHVPTPSILDDIPVIAPSHAPLPVVAPSHPEQREE